MPAGVPHKPSVHEIKNQTINDLIFVMSEVSCYLPSGDSLNQSNKIAINYCIDFLEMIVSVLSMRNIHQESSAHSYYEELLHFGCKSVANLIPKLPKIDESLVDKIFQLFLSLKSLRIRTALSQGL